MTDTPAVTHYRIECDQLPRHHVLAPLRASEVGVGEDDHVGCNYGIPVASHGAVTLGDVPPAVVAAPR